MKLATIGTLVSTCGDDNAIHIMKLNENFELRSVNVTKNSHSSSIESTSFQLIQALFLPKTTFLLQYRWISG